MTTRNKILLSVGAVCLVAVIAVVAVVAVFAARSQTVNSPITVTYKSKQVIGKASAKYYLGDTTTGKDMKTGGSSGETEITFAAGTAAAEPNTLQPQENIDFTTLAEDKLYVVFEYIFENQGNNPFSATLKVQSLAVVNANVYVHESPEAFEFASHVLGSDDSSDWHLEGDKATDYFTNVEIQPQETHHFYVVVYVSPEKSGSDASYSGTFQWTLNGSEAKAA